MSSPRLKYIMHTSPDPAQVRPLNSAKYTLTCTGFGPDVKAQPITISINPPFITSGNSDGSFITSGNSVGVSIHAPAGTYTFNRSVDWKDLLLPRGTVTKSMPITSDGSPQTVVWANVPKPMERNLIWGRITAARCTITPSDT